jgi:hypothetical protein
MNTKIASALILSFALIGGAQAANSFGDTDNAPFAGAYGQQEAPAASRAQVAAELQQARAAGLVTFGESDNAPFTAQAESTVTRAQVAQEAVNAGANGSVAFGDSDNVPFQG